jgi:hypothetical protein
MIVNANEVCFIITAAEVRNAMIDRRHITCVVTAALTAAQKMFTYTKDDFLKRCLNNLLLPRDHLWW